ncbi:preprotein translocase subunit SecA [Desulfobacteraceae bacterium SEEP-SAG9]|nr:preprotein translocase subunit SecA [Desulfobacteraceae bacterium SEEP-SAG9]
MILNFLTKIFGSKNERELKKLQPIVEKINTLEPELQAMSDGQLKARTSQFKERLKKGESMEDVLPETFATVREASVRTLNMRHFDVQLVGGIVLHQGKIAEMKTGEGKTLAATLPAYLNALTGRGVHIVTVNDYLARRDTEWMGQIYNFLGISVGSILHGLDDNERKAAYRADISYGTNNEFGFDYLRDNMKFDRESLVQPELNFAIVDEVDSILVDEARTPLIISGPAEKSTHLYYQVNSIIPKLVRDRDFTIDEKARTSVLTEDGVANCEKILKVDNLYDPKYIELLHHINQGLKAHTLFKLDVDYIVKQGEVIIVDEFTGRLMPGRRYSEGLHQALEAKENVKIENENQTLATITFQNYFRMYNKLAGMTGTADTEAAEFKKIYELDVIAIPTHKTMIRTDYADVIYKTREEKYEAALDEISELNEKGQPVLVGTISIDVSEGLSKKLKKKGIKHTVLNAKNHEKEAEIIAMAGQKGAVTISTNMAGRGTDIVLGEQVTELDGLHILGTERHESRRIDNQLRGRSGRQGDPGSSRFYLSLEDDLLRIFGGERIGGIMEKLGMEKGEPIEHNLISKAIENAQSKVEGHNFDIRKQLLEYDDVMNQQREVIYKQRREALAGKDSKTSIQDMIMEKAEEIADLFADERALPEDWDIKGLDKAVFKQFNFRLNGLKEKIPEGLTGDGLAQLIYESALKVYEEKEDVIGAEDFRNLERIIMLQTVDNLWKDHLLSMDHLKEGIGLRGYAQQNPLIVYKKEGFEMFQDMIARVKEEVVGILFRIQIAEPEKMDILRQPQEQDLVFSGADDTGETKKKPVKRTEKKVGRNAPCPCGSGKKYKKCCGA